MIPKIIHQIWLGKKKKPWGWMETWHKKHKNYDFYLWDDNTVKSFQFVNQDLINSFLERKIYHGAADVIRYELLFHYGGFVAPADSECLMSIEPLLKEPDCFACYENETVRPGLVSPHLGCIPSHPLMKELIKRLSTLKEPKGGWTAQDPWQVTGNKFLTEVIRETNSGIRIYPSYYFIPEHYTGAKSEEKPNFAKHHWYTTKGEK